MQTNVDEVSLANLLVRNGIHSRCHSLKDCCKGRAAKLSLLNFLSLFRALQKPTRFGGGVSSRSFPLSPQGTKSSVYPGFIFVGRDTHFGKYDKNKDLLCKNNRSIKFPQFREILLQFRVTWRSRAISGRLGRSAEVTLDKIGSGFMLRSSMAWRKMRFFRRIVGENSIEKRLVQVKVEGKLCRGRPGKTWF